MDGPFAVEESASLNRPFSQQHRDWVSRLLADQVQTTKYRAVRSQIFNLLQVRDFAGIRQLLSEEQLRQQSRERGHQLLARLFNIVVETHQIHTKLREFSSTADAVINYLRNKVLSPYVPQLRFRCRRIPVSEGHLPARHDRPARTAGGAFPQSQCVDGLSRRGMSRCCLIARRWRYQSDREKYSRLNR